MFCITLYASEKPSGSCTSTDSPLMTPLPFFLISVTILLYSTIFPLTISSFIDIGLSKSIVFKVNPPTSPTALDVNLANGVSINSITPFNCSIDKSIFDACFCKILPTTSFCNQLGNVSL